MATIEDRWHRTVDGERVRTSRYGRGLRWRVRYRDPAGDGRTRSFAAKADADRFRAAVETSLAESTYLDPTRGRSTVGELADVWLELKAKKRKARTSSSYAEIYRSIVASRWARTPVARVEYADVDVWIAEISSGMSASRVHHAHFVLRSILDLAVRDRRIRENPARGVELPSLPMRGRHVYLTHGQLAALADAAGAYRPLILVLGYCGLRWGEAIALRPRDVDQLRRRLIVQRTIVEDAGRLSIGTPKTHQIREVPIAEPAYTALLEALDGKRPDELVFTSPKGNAIRYSNWRRNVFDKAVAAIGIPGVKPHSLRHTAASLAVASGADVKLVQRMLGHARASMTLDVYADLFESDLDDVARRMSEAAAAAPAWTPPPRIARA